MFITLNFFFSITVGLCNFQSLFFTLSFIITIYFFIFYCLKEFSRFFSFLKLLIIHNIVIIFVLANIQDRAITYIAAEFFFRFVMLLNNYYLPLFVFNYHDY